MSDFPIGEQGMELVAPNRDRLVVYKDSAGEWRWKLVAGNGQRISASGEAFSSRYNAERAARNANPRHEPEIEGDDE